MPKDPTPEEISSKVGEELEERLHWRMEILEEGREDAVEAVHVQHNRGHHDSQD